MKLQDAREHYYTFSGSLSNVNRQVGFAGIAVIWIFVVSDGGGTYKIPTVLLWPLGLFVAGLTADLLHYAIASISWSAFHRLKEKQGTSETDEFKAPDWINYIPLTFFWGKVILTLIGYILLLRAIAS